MDMHCGKSVTQGTLETNTYIGLEETWVCTVGSR